MRRFALVCLVGCGAAATAARPPAPVAVTIAPDAGATASSDPGILVEGENIRLPDGTVVSSREDRCVEVKGSSECNAVDTGETEVLVDKWLLYRDNDHRFRVREVKPRTVTSSGPRGTLAIGDHAKLGPIAIHWHGVARVTATNEAIIELEIRNPAMPIPKRARVTRSRPKMQVTVPESPNVIDLELLTSNDDATEIVLEAAERDPTTKGAFGEPLGDGSYVFPDGLRITYRYARECDFDTSTPCIWHHDVVATMGKTEKSLSLTFKAPSLDALGHRFKIVNEKLVVTR